MRRLLGCSVAVCGLLAAGAAQANPTLLAQLPKAAAYSQGLRHGLMGGGVSQVVRLNPVVGLNPMMSAMRPAVAAQVISTIAAGQQGRALRAYMVGNVPLGELRSTGGSYLTGQSQGLTAAQLTLPY